MRTNIVHAGADELTYEIREIFEVGRELEKLGMSIVWENIGDPVAKGHPVPPWIRDIIKKTVNEDNSSFAYSPTKGLLATREFLAKQANKENGTNITAEDILFFNGLGDAISKVYTYLNKSARVIGPNPAYPTHSSAEGAHAGSRHITYTLNPKRNWLPDLEELRNKVKYNPNIAGILIINPDNPTGMVYPERVLREIVAIAKEFGLFIVCDEIYARITYGPEKMVPIAKVLGDVPGIAMRGLSKEIPWPGSRCGWIEVYNKDKDPMFARYVKTLVDAKMLEVCATTLPQRVIPEIFSDERYAKHLTEQSREYEERAEIAYSIFKKVSGILAPKPAAAFYMTVVFEDGVLRGNQTLSIQNARAKESIEKKMGNIPFDRRFAYYLMASRGICVVPLSGFNSSYQGFRITLLESDKKKLQSRFETIAQAMKEYLAS
ncbi:MAG: pyridoxal phosphate-dependent aminotransferase [Candidatus Yonathbacteria bacterium]|nr:pyridoxal phosphate-dependent aminotransferase [Candidatus Yonathbacteria bacterium]